MEKPTETTNHDQDLSNLKHVCKLCNKTYPSGKSLGGHMRSHVIANTHYNKSKHTLKFTHRSHDHDHVDAADDDDGYRGHYGLRDNPKKTWRIVDSSFSTRKDREGSDHERVCKQCGKVFQSLKALCGHMSCHSDNNKDKYFKRNADDDDDDDDDDDISWSSGMGVGNDRENNCKKRFTRSSYNAAFGGGSCSNNSEIDQLEHDQEVAMCLMMLSRDHHNNSTNDDGVNDGSYLNVYRRGGSHKISPLHLIGTESSDNNSVILEGGSSSNFVRTKVVECKKKKMNVGEEMDNSDSGYFENGAKELESDGSVDGVARSWYSKKPKLDLDSGLVESNEGYNKNDQNESKFECLRCNKRFRSHQLLVSHYMNHSSSSISPEKPQFGTNSTTPNTSGKGIMVTNDAKKGSGTKKVKGHKCPYCPKVFKSGQALGGHKRTHMMGSGAAAAAAALVVSRTIARDPTPEPEQKQPLIDLNLPAPVDEEPCGNSQYVSW